VPEITNRAAIRRAEDKVINFISKHDVLVHAHWFGEAKKLLEQPKGTKVHFGWKRLEPEIIRQIVDDSRRHFEDEPTWYIGASQIIRGYSDGSATYLPGQSKQVDAENPDTYPALALISNEKLKETGYYKNRIYADQENVIGVVTLTKSEVKKIMEKTKLAAFQKRSAVALYVKAAKMLRDLKHDPANGFHLNPNREVYKTQ
jgi:hypothetical protein